MPAAATRRRGAGQGYTILVVDDDPRIVELLHIALGAHSYRVISAGNGEDALSMAFNEQPDLVILDVRLPRRSGYEVCRAIRREPELADLPIIMVSALSDTEARLQGLERGADDYLTKPFSPKELIAKVRRCLERAEKHKALDRRSRELAGELERSREELRRSQIELRRERDVRDAYDRLAKDLARLNHPEEVASTFLFSLMTHLGAQVAALLEPRENESEQLAPSISRGLETQWEESISLDSNGEVCQLLMALGRPVRREELERFPEMRAELGPVVSAGMAVFVPVSSRGRLVAVALIGEKSEPAPYTGLDIEMAANLSRAAALAIEQAVLMKHAQSTFEQAIHAHLASVEARNPQAAWHASIVAQVCDALARDMGSDDTASRKLRLEALSDVLEVNTDNEKSSLQRLFTLQFKSEPSSLESEILLVARAFVDLVDGIEAGSTPEQIVAQLNGDRHVVQALEELLARGDLAPSQLLSSRDTSAA